MVEKYGLPKVYFPEAVFDELKKREMPVNEANERLIREELRERFGLRGLSIKAIERIKEIKGNFVLAESLYSWEEYLHFKEEYGENFLTLAVYAPPRTRYLRLETRSSGRALTNEEAKSRDHSQIENLHQAGPIAMADFTVQNEGGLEALVRQVDEIMKVLENRR